MAAPPPPIDNPLARSDRLWTLTQIAFPLLPSSTSYACQRPLLNEDDGKTHNLLWTHNTELNLPNLLDRRRRVLECDRHVARCPVVFKVNNKGLPPMPIFTERSSFWVLPVTGSLELLIYTAVDKQSKNRVSVA